MNLKIVTKLALILLILKTFLHKPSSEATQTSVIF